MANNAKFGKLTVCFEEVTPEMATEYLTHNTHNRDRKKKSIQRYAKDMAEGRWIPGVCAIIFALDGTLIDGQNRLQAVVKAGVPAVFIIVRGVDMSAQAVVDTPSLRTTADVFRLSDVANHTTVGTVVKRYKAYQNQAFYNSTKEYSNIQTLEYYKEHPEEYDKASLIGIKYNRQYNSLSRGVFGALYMYLTIDLKHSKEDVLLFFDEISDSVPSTNDTVRTFRRYIRNMEATGIKRADDGRKVQYLCRAWNAWIKGQSLTKFSTEIDNLWFT